MTPPYTPESVANLVAPKDWSKERIAEYLAHKLNLAFEQGQQYERERIVTLAWIDTTNEASDGHQHWTAEQGDGDMYEVIQSGDVVLYCPRGESHLYHCGSIDHGKQLCQQHWESVLSKYLQKAGE